MEGAVNLTKGSILKQLCTLALPIIATSFIQMAYNLTDIAWVGHLSSEAVAAVGACGIITWMSGSIALLNKVGSEVTIGQSVGLQDEVAAKGYASHNTMIALIISLVWSLLIFLFATRIIGLFLLEDNIASMAVTYLRIIAAGMPFFFLSSAFIGIFNGSGNTKTPLLISGTGLLLNMILDPLLIYVFKLGTTGAAIATIISQITVFVLFIYLIKIKKTLLGGFSFWVKVKWNYVKKIILIGAPVAALNVVFSLINMTLGRLASAQGGHIGLMTQTTGGQIEAVTWNTSQGFSSALSTFVAQNFAVKKFDRVTKAYKSTLSLSVILGLLSTLLFVFFGQEVFSLIVPEEAAYIAGGRYLRISGYSQVFMMLEITTQGLFYGIGRSFPPAIISISLNCLRIPLALLFISLGLGVLGIWWAISLSSVLKGILAIVWFLIVINSEFGNRKN